MYKQQLRTHARQFLRNRLPENQAAMFTRPSDNHRYKTRAAESGLLMYSNLDPRSIGYRLPKEWQATPHDVREINSLQGMKAKSKVSFLTKYAMFNCDVRDCYVCGSNAGNASGR